MDLNKELGADGVTFRDGFSATPDCPPLSALLDQASSPSMQSHISQCPHCRTELALHSQMQQPADPRTVGAIEKRLAGVNWAEAGRSGIPSRPESVWQRLLRPRFLGPAFLACASVLAIVTVVQMNRPMSQPDLRDDSGARLESQRYRSQQLRGLAPLGSIGSAPNELRWEKVQGAVAYEARLMEVDHTTIWQLRVPGERAVMPQQAVGKIRPGKRMLWEVKAFGADGKEIASSATVEFTTSLQ